MKPAARARLSESLACWMARLATPADPIAALADALGSAWTVERQRDCMGKTSITVFPAVAGDDLLPTYIIYEEGGVTQVGKMRGDEWESACRFASMAQAVAAIVAEAAGGSAS